MSFLELHILQTVPPSNMNRDDTGSPKTAVFGGQRRARVSSQAWKRATRQAFKDMVDAEDLGFRTTRLVELVAGEVIRRDESVDSDEAEAMAKAVLEALGLKPKAPRKSKSDDDANGAARTEYLVFLSARQIENLAELALAARGGSLDKKQVKIAAQSDHSIDVALFGRMVADDATLNVDAAVQVSHALSTHAVDNEFDYYTAVDDKSPREETGAGMIGTIEFNSATLYRYATVNIDTLVDNLGSAEAANRAIGAFVKAFITSMPTGKQNTFANRTLPDAVVATVRDDQPISFVGAFEQAVARTDQGWVKGSARALADYATGVTSSFAGAPRAAWVVAHPSCAKDLEALGEKTTLDRLVDNVGSLAGTP